MKDKKKYFGEPIKTPVFRASFVSVFNLDKFGDHSLAMLFPKDTDLSEIKAAAKKLALEYWDGVLPPPDKFGNPFKNGDEPNGEGNVFEGHAGCIVVNAKTGADKPPKVVDQNRQPVTDQNMFYSGCYAHAYITPRAYDQNGNKGIGFFLGNIQLVKKGDPLGGGGPVDPAKQFDDIASSESEEAYAGTTDDVFGDTSPAAQPSTTGKNFL